MKKPKGFVLKKLTNYSEMKLVGRRFKTTAIKSNIHDSYRFFGIDSKLRHMWGVGNDEPIYELEFEVVKEYAKYPEDPRQIEYWCFARIEDSEPGSYPVRYVPREKPEFELVECNAIAFTVQFCQPVFKYQYQPGYGVVCRLKLINAKEWNE